MFPASASVGGLFFWVGNSLPDWRLSCGASTVPARIPKNCAWGALLVTSVRRSPVRRRGFFFLRETRQTQNSIQVRTEA